MSVFVSYRNKKHWITNDELLVLLKNAFNELTDQKDTTRLMNLLLMITKNSGGISRLAKRAKTNRQLVYRVLGRDADPKLKAFSTILNELGYKLTLEPISSTEKKKTEESLLMDEITYG